MRKLFPLAIAGIVLGVVSLHGDDWPNWRGPRHDGIARATGLLTSWAKEGPRVAWKTSLTGGYSSVAVAAGRLFTQAKEKAEETVLCFDAITGKKLWEFRYPCDYELHKKHLDQRFKSGPRCTPTVDGDRVYTIGTAGDLFCLEAKTGKKIWHLDLLKMAERTIPDYGYSNSPFIVGERLFVHPGGPKGCSLAALDKGDGRVLWKALDDKIGWATPMQYDFQGATQLVYFTASGPVAVAPADGKLLWRHEWKTDFDLNVAAPIYSEGRLFISSNYGRGGALLRLKDKANPEVIWQNQSMTNHFSCSVLHEGHLYGFSNARLRCVEFATGKVKWDKDGLGRGSVVLADNHVIALGEQGTLVLAEASPKAYVEKARWQALTGRCWSVPVLANGLLYVRHETQMLALEIAKRRMTRRSTMSDALPRTISKELQFKNGKAIGISNRWHKGQYCTILTEAGLVGCGIYDVKIAAEFGQAVAIARGTPQNPLVNPEDLFDAKIVEATPQAKALGIEIGMTGRDAVECLLAASAKR